MPCTPAEILAGPACCLSIHGSGSRVLLESCYVDGDANFGCLVSDGYLELQSTQVSQATVAGICASGPTAELVAGALNWSAIIEEA